MEATLEVPEGVDEKEECFLGKKVFPIQVGFLSSWVPVDKLTSGSEAG